MKCACRWEDSRVLEGCGAHWMWVKEIAKEYYDRALEEAAERIANISPHPLDSSWVDGRTDAISVLRAMLEERNERP